MFHNVEQLVSEHCSVPHREERLASDVILLLGIPIINPHRDDPSQGLVHWSLGGTSLYLVKLGPHSKAEEGVIVVEVRKSFQMELPPPDVTYHIQKRRIRSPSVAMAEVESAKIMTGDVKTEVNDESIIGSGQSIHGELVVVVLVRCWESC